VLRQQPFSGWIWWVDRTSSGEVDDGDLGLVGERERALSGVGVADAEVMHPPVRAP
jgi:hypothetical protein